MLRRSPATVAALLVVLFVAAGCGGTSAQPGADVSVQEAFKMWQNKEAVVIDVRTPEEYRQGHIPGVVNIPLDQLSARAGEVPTTAAVLLICRSGNRSGQGTSLLRARGFANVYNVAGGMNEWPGPVVSPAR